MRELKFRAWDKRNREMLYIDPFEYLQAIWSEKCGGEDCSFSNGLIDVGRYLKIPDDVELMQFTGLKDKNGKEIYEGDIVRFWDRVNKKHEQYVILWDDEDAHFGAYIGNSYHGNQFCWGHTDWTIYSPEVIGNIYENPELIKETAWPTRRGKG